MSSFFIRPKSGKHDGSNKESGGSKKLGKRFHKKTKGRIYESKTKKRKFESSKTAVVDDEEITSDEDLLENETKGRGEIETDDDDNLTPQEKKLELAKKYLQEIEEEEKKKAEDENVDDAVLGRLREEVLRREGKWKKRVADKIRTLYDEDCGVFLKCKEQKSPVTCLVVTADDKLFTGSKDCTIVKWCLTSLTKIGSILPRHKDKTKDYLHSSPILCLAVSHDNRHLASGDEGNLIQVWDPKTLAHVFTFKGHRGAVTGLSFCRLTQNLYSASRDKTVKVWSVPERAYVETLFGHQEPITGLDSLAKDRVVTSGGCDMSVRLWKIDEESQLIFNGHQRSIDSVKKLSDVHFVTCGDDGSVCVWGANKKKPLHKIPKAHGISSCNEPNWIVSVACISNTEVFASGSSDGIVKIWKCDNNYRGAKVLASIPVKGFVNAMAFTEDQKRLIIGVGQEHRLGRWSRNKEAKNGVLVVQIQNDEENEQNQTTLANGSLEANESDAD